jgi:hypothetical protein
MQTSPYNSKTAATLHALPSPSTAIDIQPTSLMTVDGMTALWGEPPLMEPPMMVQGTTTTATTTTTETLPNDAKGKIKSPAKASPATTKTSGKAAAAAVVVVTPKKDIGAPSKHKVADLKQYLNERGLDTKGLKADLVARLTHALEAEE